MNNPEPAPTPITTNESKCCGQTQQELIEKINKKMPDLDLLFSLAEFFKVFGDSTRIRIMCALFQSELCVCDIAEIVNMGQSAVSHQLRILRNANIVKVRKEGKSSFYSLDDYHIYQIYETGITHIQEERGIL